MLCAWLVAASSAAAAPRPTTDALHDFEASGPVRVAFDQVVSVCATNYGPTAHGMSLAVVNATADVNQPGILATRQVQMAPFSSACLDFPAANWQPLYGPAASVIGLGVDGGFVDQGVIRQGIGVGGGGCIVSLQILDANARTVLLAPTHRHLLP
jgi:hypothetical protein